MTGGASFAELWPLAVMLLAVGGLAGVIAGLLGVGGGLVLVPAFLHVFTTLGYDGPKTMAICLATALATIIVTSARSLRAHAARGAVDRDVLRAWAPAIAAGAVGGVLAAVRLRSEALMAIFGVLGLLLGLQIGLGRDTRRLGDRLPTGAVRAAVGGTIGFLSVLMAIGGGSFGILLMRLHGFSIHRAVGTASGFGLAIAVPSVLAFLFAGWGAPSKPPGTVGLVNLPAFAAVVLSTLVTTPLGVRMAHALNPVHLRRLFGLFIVTMSLNMLRKAAWG